MLYYFLTPVGLGFEIIGAWELYQNVPSLWVLEKNGAIAPKYQGEIDRDVEQNKKGIRFLLLGFFIQFPFLFR